MFTLNVTFTAAGHVAMAMPGAVTVADTEPATEDKGPSPIAPELKELAWGGGSFLVLLALMRLFLVPRVKKGMDARYAKIVSDHDTADAVRASARSEIAEYEAEHAAIQAEAARHVDAARRTLEAERATAIADASARITAKRAEAAADTEAARAAVESHIREAVVDVSARAAELATGRRPDPSRVDDVVDSLLAGVKS